MPPPPCWTEAVAIHKLSLPVLSLGDLIVEGGFWYFKLDGQFADRKSCISRMGLEGFLESCLSAILGGRHSYLSHVCGSIPRG